MIPSYNNVFPIVNKKSEINLIVQHLKRAMPEFIFDTIKLENNPFTFPEVKTLLDGITVGGHKISDEQQILNLQESWNYIIKLIYGKGELLNIDIINSLQDKVVKYKALLVSGKFRNGNISINGTKKYTCYPVHQLLGIFHTDIEIIKTIQNPIEKATILFLWGSYCKFYYDGNTRTFRLLANAILISEGIGFLNISNKDILEYNKLMIEFYDTFDTKNVIEFLINKCLVIIK